jgi:hypothetical protein
VVVGRASWRLGIGHALLHWGIPLSLLGFLALLAHGAYRRLRKRGTEPEELDVDPGAQPADADDAGIVASRS